MLSKDQLKEKISIIILLKYFDLLPKKHNPKYRFPCPIHQGENNNCYYYSDKNIFRCYSECNKSYDIFNIYTELTGETNFNTIVKNLNQLFENETFQQFIQEHNQIKKFSTPINHPKKKKKFSCDEFQIKQIKTQLFKKVSPLFNQIRDFYHQKLIINPNNEGLEYLTKTRELSLETIKTFNLGYAPLSGKSLSFQLTNYLKKHQLFNENDLLKYGLIKQKHREDKTNYFHDSFHGSIIIPIENGNNKTFHFYENHFRQNETKYKPPKYMSLPDFSNTPTFFFSYHFFEALPFIKATKKVYIVEGFFDVIQLWNHGIKNVIGAIIIANEMSKAQIDVFKRNNIQVIVIPDNDKNETGIKAARKICKQLKKEQGRQRGLINSELTNRNV